MHTARISSLTDISCQKLFSLSLKFLMNYIWHYGASFWMTGFRLLFNWEAIDICVDTDCQNCATGKVITLKTIWYFFKCSCKLHQHLSESQDSFAIICDWLWENLPLMHKHKYLEICNSIIQSVISQEGLKLHACKLLPI